MTPVANTASTLVSRLVSDGLLVRNTNRADRRIGRLHGLDVLKKMTRMLRERPT
jgi:DNA-binding MarR family transcriptional regulator